MALTLQLDDRLEGRLKEEAGRLGLAADEYARQILSRELATGEAGGSATPPAPIGESGTSSLWGKLTLEEWSRRAREWARSHDPSIPLLPDEAVTREGIYGDHP